MERILKPSHNVDCIEFRGSLLTVVTAVLKTTDIVSLESSLVRRLSKTPDFFSDEPTIIDTSRIDYQADINWSAIVRLLCSHGLKPFAAKSVHPSHCASAVRSGLSIIGDDSDTKDFIRDQSRNDSGVVNAESVNDRGSVMGSLSINYPVRSGQQIYHKGDIVVLNVASSGSELISDGTIHVYAPLRGRALAGASGNVAAMIFTTCF
ncbi:septum site-determining protein MinC, partial [Candidatus Ichthyocystis hellenicum]|uniref:septum site-determining protein MinC n=1 Tax=Candidatus Ichthyocystis hellenicum TaxID=1561003 RepID=UPI000B87C507